LLLRGFRLGRFRHLRRLVGGSLGVGGGNLGRYLWLLGLLGPRLALRLRLGSLLGLGRRLLGRGLGGRLRLRRGGRAATDRLLDLARLGDGELDRDVAGALADAVHAAARARPPALQRRPLVGVGGYHDQVVGVVAVVVLRVR